MIKSKRSKIGRVKQLGQGMTEYIIIVGLVAIVGIAAVKTYGQELDVAIQGSGNQAKNTVNTAISDVGANESEGASGGGGRGIFGRVRDNVEREAARGRGLADTPNLDGTNPNLESATGGAFGSATSALGNN